MVSGYIGPTSVHFIYAGIWANETLKSTISIHRVLSAWQNGWLDFPNINIWLYHTIISLAKRIEMFFFVHLVAVNFHEDHYWMLSVRQSFPTSHFFRFCWKPVPKLIANDQNKGEETMAYRRIGDRQGLAMKIFTDVSDISQQSGVERIFIS